MADQKSRGGQKEGFANQPGGGGENRDVHEGENEKQGRDMKEDAQRGRQDDAGGYNLRPHHQKEKKEGN